MSLLDWVQTPPPDVAVQIDREQVSAARLDWRGREPRIAAHHVEALPAGAVAPGLSALNMADVGLVGQAVSRVLGALGGRTTRVALVLPDTVAKVSLIRLDKVPPRAADLQEIVRWQLRKSAPFPMEQAVVSISPGAESSDGGRELVVSLAREDVIRQYEQTCTMAGAHAGLVDLASFGVFNGIIAGGGAPTGDWLLVHATPTYVTLAVARGDRLLFLRNRGDEAEGTLSDIIHQTAMYYEDRLDGRGFERVWLAGASQLPEGPNSVRRGIEERLGVTVEAVDPRAAGGLSDRIDAAPELLDTLAPLVGVLRRDRKAA
jgi:hypothetical protein